MCELLAVNANDPVPVALSWRGFRHRGEKNPDGWGIAYLCSEGFIGKQRPKSILTDESSTPAVAEITTRHFLSHVRYMIQGEMKQENTQPFCSSDGARAFAATMSNCRVTYRFREEVAHRIKGETGPEILFAMICMEKHIEQVVKRVFLNCKLSSAASASFVYSDGNCQYAFSLNRRLFHLTRKPPHTRFIRLNDPVHQDLEVNLQMEKGPSEVATLIASEPLTDEDWKILPDRALTTVRNGQIESIVDL